MKKTICCVQQLSLPRIQSSSFQAASPALRADPQIARAAIERHGPTGGGGVFLFNNLFSTYMLVTGLPKMICLHVFRLQLFFVGPNCSQVCM